MFRSAHCVPPVLCQPASLELLQRCPLEDGSSGAICPPPGPLQELGRPLADPGRWALRARLGSFSAVAAQRRAASVSAQLAELERRLAAAARPAGAQEADLTELTTAAGGDPAIGQEVGRIALQRLYTIQAVANQTRL